MLNPLDLIWLHIFNGEPCILLILVQSYSATLNHYPVTLGNETSLRGVISEESPAHLLALSVQRPSSFLSGPSSPDHLLALSLQIDCH